MLNALRRAGIVGLCAVLAAFVIPLAQAADPSTTAFALADEDADGVINVEEYRNRMIVVFVALDEDGDGYLVESELPDGQKDVFPVADANGNGKLGLREHLVFIMPRFWKADYDGDNVLSLPEVTVADKREAAY